MEKQEYTLHVDYGLCRILGNVTRNVNGQDSEFVKLQDVDDESVVIFIPLDQLESRTRPSPSPEAMQAHIDSMLVTPIRAPLTANERWKVFTKMSLKRDLQSQFDLLVYLHDTEIQARRNDRKLTMREQPLYDRTFFQIAIEITLSLKVSQEEAEAIIRDKLKERNNLLHRKKRKDKPPL